MALAEWKEKLRIGIDFVDKDHMALFALVNRLHGAMANAKGREEAGPVLVELQQYAESHFTREEAMLSTKHYPDLPKHHKLHESFVDKIKLMREKHDSGNSLVSIEILKFLNQWLHDHIAEDDKLYRAYLEKLG